MAQRTDLEKELETTIFRMIDDYSDILKIGIDDGCRGGRDNQESYARKEGYYSIEVCLMEADFDRWADVLMQAQAMCDNIIAELKHEYNHPNFAKSLVTKKRFRNIIK